MRVLDLDFYDPNMQRADYLVNPLDQCYKRMYALQYTLSPEHDVTEKECCL
jgi:hypothetical protein